MRGYLFIISEEEKKALLSLIRLEEQILKLRLNGKHTTSDRDRYYLYKNLYEKLTKMKGVTK